MERWRIGKGTEEPPLRRTGIVTGRRINSSEGGDGWMSRQYPLGECLWSTR